MASRQPTRFLFLDDSGHPAPNYGSGAVVIGGVWEGLSHGRDVQVPVQRVKSGLQMVFSLWW